ncbi:methyltransferase FkbM family protein [Arthrospira platensis NIES-46]|jgi:FkbM family methyltransferase|uniref:Methyltransferase FkbM family protein n=1 Tax=Limnospira platensis NIES-46 TaxID=1236695 RepID=A0A5M3TEF4_LIMPL|nr:FkbM family methyltransferase [Arthrospira platensis]GCE96460.1 methyltransferase FkbM family protein [Arthrospira platensis NIES-46]
MITLALPTLNYRHNQPKNLVLNGAERAYVARMLAENGIGKYEPHTMATALLLLQEVANQRIFFDIGANIGVYSFFLASVLEPEGLSIHAFEPTPNLAEIARKIAKDNSLLYHLEELALGKSSGTSELYLSRKTDSSNSLLKGFRESSKSISVLLETVDNYCKKIGFMPSVMKIDTEATEPDVLLGCSETINKNRPWIICEVLAGRTESKLMEVMKLYGYHYYHINDSLSWMPQAEIYGDTTYQYRDWLFAPEPINQGFVDEVHQLVGKMAV